MICPLGNPIMVVSHPILDTAAIRFQGGGENFTQELTLEVLLETALKPPAMELSLLLAQMGAMADV